MIGGWCAVAFVAGCADTPTSPSSLPTGVTIGESPQTSPPVPPRISVTPACPVIGVTRFLAYGDSLTWGAMSSFDARFLFAAANGGYVERLEMGLNAHCSPQQFSVANHGEPGELARNALSRFRASVSSVRPQAVLLLEGINDLNNGFSVSQTIGALQQLVNHATASGAPVIIATMFQTYQSTDANGVVRENSADKIPAFNAAIRSTFANRLNVHILDLEPQMTERSLVGNDGLHLTDAGYDRMASLFLKAIETAFPVRGSFH